jgi:hypothetical protein
MWHRFWVDLGSVCGLIDLNLIDGRDTRGALRAVKEVKVMNRVERSYKLRALMGIVFACLLTGGGVGRGFAEVARGVTVAPGTLLGAAAEPTVTSSSPSHRATNVPTSMNDDDNFVTGTAVTATFSHPMDAATVSSSFTVREANGNEVPGVVVMNAENTVATFTPSLSALNPNTSYSAAVSTEAKNLGGVAMANPIEWRFTTSAVPSTGQKPVALGKAGTFAILSKTGITDVYASAITGDVGSSPITGAAIHLTCAEMMSGTIYSVNAAGPLPCRVTDPTLLTTAVSNMQTAYSNAAGRTLPDFVDLGAGLIGGLTLVPGLYKWNTRVLMSTNVTLSGGADAVWIFQIAGTLTQANGTQMILAGGAQQKNIFWQASGNVSIGTTAHAEGVILAKTLIAMKTSASANGRLLAQTAVTLEQNAVTQP